MQTKVNFRAYWQKIHSLCPSSSLKNIQTSSAFVFFFPSPLRRGGRRECCCVLCGPILGEPRIWFVARPKVRWRFAVVWRSGVWGIPSLESVPGLGDRKDSAPGDGGCEVMKGGAGEDAGERNGLRSLSSGLRETLKSNKVWINIQRQKIEHRLRTICLFFINYRKCFNGDSFCS